MKIKKHNYSEKAANAPFHLFLMAIFLITTGIPCTSVHADQSKRVLVLHSYHQGHTWTDNIMRGIQAVFDSSDFNIMLHIEYMDTKRYAPRESFSQLSRLYEFRYRDILFDAILVSDNNALSFLLSCRDTLFPDAPVVFCGINNFTDSLIAGNKAITGVVEAIDIRGTLEMALRLHPRTRQVVIINDRTPTGMSLSRNMQKIMPDFSDRVTFSEFIDVTDQELRESLRQLPDNTLLLPLVFFQDRAGTRFSDKEFIPFIANSRDLPLYSMWEHYMGLGVLGGIVTSGELQGHCAACMAVKILRGESADNIPILRKSPNIPMFDYTQMERFGISLSDIPPGNIVINKPFSFYETYTRLIWTVVAIIIMLISLIVALIRNILQRRRVEKELLLKERLAVLGHFAGNISHELRNPLAVIDSAAYFLKMKLGNSDEKIARQLDFISRNVSKSTAIIESLLNLSRMEKPNTAKTDLIGLASETLDSSRIPDTIKTVTNYPENSLFINVEAEQIRMALKNIIKNAVQAMDDAGKLTMSLRSGKSGYIELIVSDTGPGIAPDHLKKVFEPLFSTKIHGIGFGLSITKMIVENHGGRVQAISASERGATFVLTLPLGEKGEL